jgi:cyclic beta-1,2-glucan synthetase
LSAPSATARARASACGARCCATPPRPTSACSRITALALALVVIYARLSGAGWPLALAFALLSLPPATDLAVSVLNFDITHLLPPRLLPKLDTSQGVGPEGRTFVVVPTIFSDAEAVDELLARLEVHYLANRGEQFYFALLGDFADADAEEKPEDRELVERALEGVERLNARHAGGGEGAARFHLFHRRRLWNPREGRWMGWERKRGKLDEFNRLLRGACDTSFAVATADPALLSSVRYVITLDSDTQLPRDAARRLVGAALHPLNRPVYDRAAGRVTRGYSILQPRVSVTLESAARSRFAGIFSGNTGIDPYTTAASDVYQDLFGEGIYTGKGLYDVDAFALALDGRAPENALLSHDLFECIYARAALASDIELLDDYPAAYDVYAKRQHRWARGDWQLARWLLPRVPAADGRRVRNRLPLAARWKIFDNLRRSMSAPGLALWLTAAWAFVPGSPAAWTLFALLVLSFPVYAHVTTSLLNHPRGVPWTSHFWSVWGDVWMNTKQAALLVVLVAHQAYMMCDAALRTVWRVLFSKRRLLEWTTAAQAERGSARDLASMLRFMWPAPLIAAACASLVILFRPEALAVALPVLAAWALSPAVAFRVSRPARQDAGRLGADEERAARLVARRTWRFFERFVGPEDNWLPPDNFQEDPERIAHRTSPTNVGLLLLSTTAAHDFGYVGTLELVERLEQTLESVERLPKFRGHLLNWYDTRTLEPLLPQYVSTVDSGNLAGHLLALKQACEELPDRALFGAHTLAGLRDTVALLRHEAERIGGARQRTEIVTANHLRQEIAACERVVAADPPETLGGWEELLDSLHRHASTADDMLGALAQEHGAGDYAEAHFWAGALLRRVKEFARDLRTFAPTANPPGSPLGYVTTTAGALQSRAGGARELDRVGCLGRMSETYDTILTELAAHPGGADRATPPQSPEPPAAGDLASLTTAVEAAALAVSDILSRASRLARRCGEAVEGMDFGFLLDDERKVFRIGYNVTAQRADDSYYDLLASEARLASFVAIALGQAPQEHWFRLGRQFTPAGGGRALVSWTATMFEYLMPLLVMRSYPGTLLDETHRSAVRRQIEYGDERGVPWGISESAYNARDLQLNYQYGPFGVPGLGLKRGLSEDLVVAPYATLLALTVAPRRALENLHRLEREGALGRYGFYESIDYTPERLPQNQKRVVIRAYMTHHQGMGLVALGNLLNDSAVVRRFHSEPLVQATELLLQERIPRGVPASHPRAEEVLSGRVVRSVTGLARRSYDTADLPTPRTQILANGNYSVMVTSAGSGYSRSGGLAVTRWREDAVRDHHGTFIYLRDARSGSVWSAGHQPVGAAPSSYEVSFSEDKVEISRTDGQLHTRTEIIVSPEDDAEVRRVTLTNKSSRPREIELTSYAEVVLAPHAADVAHPAFSNLFVETEFIPAEDALLARRRPRSGAEEPVWGVHVVRAEGATVGAVQYETDRSRFLGRGRTAANPAAVFEERPLSNTAGAVLDPIFSLRRRVRLKPGERVRVLFATGVARTREEALALADKYHDHVIFEREERLAWTRAQVEMRHLNISADEAHLFQRLAGRVLYSDPSLRPRPHVLAMNRKAQSGLWPYGIGGDLPIVLVRINRAEHLGTVRQMLHAHEYLRLRGLQFDLVVLNDHPHGYADELQQELQSLMRMSAAQGLQDKPGGVFLRRAEHMPEADRILLHAVARVVIVTERGTLAEQLVRRPAEEKLPPAYVPRAALRAYPDPGVQMPELAFFNGLGGFSRDGREYLTVLGEGQWTPAPWSNVVANGHDFGFVVTESGGGYTWSVNSRENRLTPWSNDAVSDPPGDAVYLRDEETGAVWTPTPLPVREREPYVVRHGQGYTVFEHASHGLAQELLAFVPADASVKITVVRLRNRGERKRLISATSYSELVLGVTRGSSAPHVVTEIDEGSGAVFARNYYNNEFAGRVAFAAASPRAASVTCDRKEFIGRNGTPDRPAALARAHLSGRAGAGLDPCAALQAVIELAPGESREVIFLLGEAATAEEARATVARFSRPQDVEEAFSRVLAEWDEGLEAVTVRTPDEAMNAVLNRWLLYQTLACRVWARSAFYQSGGAYGFRDQLQDVMALVYSRPRVARDQIVRAASRQFPEGDVQHWWHPPTGRGVRTRFSDDLLWLAYVAAFYVEKTGDSSVLDERAPFIDAPPLAPGEDESYTQPTVTEETATVYEHCVRAIDRSLAVGEHGLPLMGSGDWNDGMNRVGHEGRGESVWVGWFLYDTLTRFGALSDARADAERAARYREHAARLKRALEEHAWDGDWYLRAFFDDGTPLGSVRNEECRIDSIAQSWGVISGAADGSRAHRAMAAVDEYLIRRGEGLVMLFTPPFDRSDLDPGYIKGYVPGVRENGGQYTHAALWTVIAFALLGDGDRAGELFALLNPVNHASTRAGVHKYKVEPYVAAADVYAIHPHTGRGGWTWYTGSAGWMYRAALEFILGFRLHGARLSVEPCVPRWWREFEINFRRGSTRYRVVVENPLGVCRGVTHIEADGETVEGGWVEIRDDGKAHTVRVRLGETAARAGERRDDTPQERALEGQK